MRYWNCIFVPGMTNKDVGDPTSPVEEPDIIDVSPIVEDDPVTNSNETVDVLSDQYKLMRNQAFGVGDTTADTNGETPCVVSSEKTPEEIDALKYVSPDDADISNYDIAENSSEEFQTVDPETIGESVPLYVSEENSNQITEPVVDKSALLSCLFNGGEDLATTIAEKVVENIVEPPAPEFSLDEEKLQNVIDTLGKYEEEYFKEIPIKHLSNRFLRNITKEVYRAHEDATLKYEDPPLMDPIFLMYPLTTEDPYMSMGKFWSIVTEKISNNRKWLSAISKSVSEYDEYMKMLAEEEDENCDANTESESVENK